MNVKSCRAYPPPGPRALLRLAASSARATARMVLRQASAYIQCSLAAPFGCGWACPCGWLPAKHESRGDGHGCVMSYPLLLGKEVIPAFIHLRITSQGQDQLLITHCILIETHPDCCWRQQSKRCLSL